MKPKTVMRADGEDRHAGAYAPYATLDTGLLQGAKIFTLSGEMPVEFLSVGDKLITRASGSAQVHHIQRSTRLIQQIGLAAGSLGHNRPEKDAFLAADQMVLIRDWRAKALFNSDVALVPARSLVDGEFITDLGTTRTTVYQVFCDAPHILYCDGLELGTADSMDATQRPTLAA